jgi:predicted HTH transcriptional regulator
MSLLKTYTQEGEHESQLFLTELDIPEIAKHLVALANTKGGRIIFGAKPNGKFKGVDPKSALDAVQNAATKHCMPQIKFVDDTSVEDFRPIVCITVEPAPKHEYKVLLPDGKWKKYMRIEKQSQPVTKIIESVWDLLEHTPSKGEEFLEEKTILLAYLGTHTNVTLSQLYKNTNLGMQQIDTVLPLLITAKLVEYQLTPDSITYTKR